MSREFIEYTEAPVTAFRRAIDEALGEHGHSMAFSLEQETRRWFVVLRLGNQVESFRSEVVSGDPLSVENGRRIGSAIRAKLERTTPEAA